MRVVYLTAKFSNMDIIILPLFVNLSPCPPRQNRASSSFKIIRFCYTLLFVLSHRALRKRIIVQASFNRSLNDLSLLIVN